MKNLSSDSDKKRLLAIAALFERNFSLDWLLELTGYKAGSILAAMEEGIQQGFLDRQPGWFFAFKSSEMKKQWEECFSSEENEHWHCQIAELLFREYPNEVRNAAAVAGHLLHIKNDLNGCRLLMRAADAVGNAKSFQTVLTYYGKILDDLSKIPGLEADTLSIEIALKYASICGGRVDPEAVNSVFQEAGAKAENRGLLKERCLIEMYIAHTYFLQSKFGRAIEYFEKGWVLAKSLDDSAFLESVRPFHSFSFFCEGRCKKVIRSYEESAQVIEIFSPENYEFAGTVGLAYALSGHFSQGLGLLDAIRKQCMENENQFNLNNVYVNMATLMIQLVRPDEAISFLNNITDDEDSEHSIRARYLFSYANYLKGDKEEAFRHLKYGLERRLNVNISINTNETWFALCNAMEVGELPAFEGVRLEDEINFYLAERNVLMKGIAYRYKAFLHERQGFPLEQIIENLKLSSQLLEEAGAVFEQCRSLQALIRLQALKGDQWAIEKGKEKITTILGGLSQNFVPNDLKGFINAGSRDPKSLIEEILSLSQDMSTIRDEKRLMQLIISKSNRITGAERGAIFGIKKDGQKLQINLKATKNITAEDIANQAFSGARKIIEEVAETGKGRTVKISSDITQIEKGRVLSNICAPMVIRNRVVGVLYHDNSIFANSFKDEDLKLLGYFGAQAAIALDHAEAYTKIQNLNKKLYQEKQYYKEQSFQNLDFENFIGKSSNLLQVLSKIKQVADTGTNVIILGETGVGKEMVARALHTHSIRRKQPFIKVLCNALPESLIASELFGHEKGAFTGSAQRRIGRFELADGGTLFLDEIGDLPMDIQTSLLRVLQSKEFERVGGSQTIHSDFRLITATNRDLNEAVTRQRFRQDLYYRLNVFPIYVPPLRERKEDIPLLAYNFFKIFSARMGKDFDGIPQKEMNKLMNHSWPGNIRELEGVIERGIIMSNGVHFRVPEIGMGEKEFLETKPKATLRDMERSYILRTLEQTGWKVRGSGGAAEILDMNYSTLSVRMKKLGIVRPPEYPRGRKKGTWDNVYSFR
jgi:formate hydrogenlyase transcriptional activator